MNIELYMKSEVCPVCGHEFKSTSVKHSRVRRLKTDTDFMVHYKTTSPLLYEALVCKECGYAALGSKFEYVSNENKKIVKEEITKKWNKQDYTGERTIEEALHCYKLALYCGQVLKYKRFELANICLRIGWMYRLKEDINSEERFLELAKKLFEKAYMSESIPYDKMSEDALTYLVGELNMRLGNYDESINWFSKTIYSSTIKSNPRIEKLARDQWSDAKAILKKEKKETEQA